MPRWEQGGKAAIIPWELGELIIVLGWRKFPGLHFKAASLSLLLAKCQREPQVILRGSAGEVENKDKAKARAQQELAGHSHVPRTGTQGSLWGWEGSATG